MNRAEAERIVDQARAAQPPWGALSVERRCVLLSSIRLELARRCESIAELIAREARKHPLDALSGDLLVTLEHLRYCEAHAARILRPQEHSKPFIFFRGAHFETQFEPHGVTLIFGASNYPLQLSLIPLTTALIAGNAVILKCSERTPETSALIARLCADAGFPSGLVQVLNEGPGESSALIDARPDFIFFTGSSSNGRQIAQKAGAHLIPGVYELGGKDASIVFDDCQMARAIEGITYGAFSNAGRVCVAVKRAYVQSSIYEKFLERLTQRAAALRIGVLPDSDFPPFPQEEESHLRLQLQDALDRGAILHYPQTTDAVFQKPAILTGVPQDARILMEESFGPVLCVAPFEEERDAIAQANASSFALSSSIWTSDRARARRVASQLSAGSCAVNDVVRVIANPHAPFGGNRLSGYGRYHGAEGLRAFSRTKTLMLSRTRRTREINWFPFKTQTSRQLALLLRFRHGHKGLLAKAARTFLPILLGVMLPLGVLAQSQADAQLSITVWLAPHAHGDLGYLVFGSPSGFPGDRSNALRHGFLPIPTDARGMHVALNLRPGTYAVSVYEDLNGNHKLDHNWLGIPREPVGVSNNPAARLGAPRFRESSFRLGPGSQTITIHVVRP